MTTRDSTPNVWGKLSEKGQQKLRKDGKQYRKVLRVLILVSHRLEGWPCHLLCDLKQVI